MGGVISPLARSAPGNSVHPATYVTSTCPIKLYAALTHACARASQCHRQSRWMHFAFSCHELRDAFGKHGGVRESVWQSERQSEREHYMFVFSRITARRGARTLILCPRPSQHDIAAKYTSRATTQSTHTHAHPLTHSPSMVCIIYAVNRKEGRTQTAYITQIRTNTHRQHFYYI